MKRTNFVRFLSYVKPVKMYFIGAILCGVYKFSIPLAVAYLFGQTIEILTNSSINPESKLKTILMYVTIGIAISLISPIFVYLRSMFALKGSLKIMNAMRIDLYEHIQKLSHTFFHKNKAGNLTSRIINDINATQMFLRQALITGWIHAIMFIIASSYLFYSNYILGFLAVALLPLQLFSIRFFGKKINVISKKLQEQSAELSGDTNEKLSNINVIKMYTAENRAKNQFARQTLEIIDTNLEVTKYQALNEVFNSVIGSVAPLIVVAVGSYLSLFHTDSVSTGLLVTFVLMQNRLYDPAIQIAALLPLISEAKAAVDRIFELLDTEPEIKEVKNPEKIEKVTGSIQLNNVSFGYDEKTILNNISLNIQAQSTIAFVGTSGSGKSTLANLLPRFYDVQSGEITLDGHNIKNLNLINLRKSIGIVPQDPMLFSGSIFENILYGNPAATKEQVFEAAKMAFATDFINEMPKGFQTEIGERGVALSGGQKQRIAIARAFLKNPPILILDEATSALDNESESKVQEALNSLMKNRTTIVIAHRLSTIRDVDKIYVFEKGKIIESGNHDELIKANGKYSRLNHLSRIAS